MSGSHPSSALEDRLRLAARRARAAALPPEDEGADPVGDGHSDAEFAAQSPPVPGRPNPEPDQPAPSPADEGELPDDSQHEDDDVSLGRG